MLGEKPGVRLFYKFCLPKPRRYVQAVPWVVGSVCCFVVMVPEGCSVWAGVKCCVCLEELNGYVLTWPWAGFKLNDSQRLGGTTKR